MPKKSLFFKTLLFTFFCLTFLLLATNKVSAKVEISDSKYTIRILPTGDGRLQNEFTLKNNFRDRKIVSSYNLTLPFISVGGIKATINGQPINFKTKTDTKLKYTNVTLNFSGNVILQRQKARIKIDFNIFQLIKRIDDFKYLQLGSPAVNDLAKFKKFEISYPQEFGDISFTTAKEDQITRQNGKINIEKNNHRVILLSWGSNLQINSSTKLKLLNDALDKQNTLFSLIPNINDLQNVTYSATQNSSYGLYDNNNNIFGTAIIEPKSELEVGFNALIKKDNGISNFTKKLNYDWTIDKNTQIGKEIQEKFINNFDNPSTKLANINTYIIKKYKPLNTLSIGLDEIPDMWNFFDKAVALNSFHYSYILISVCKELNIECQLNYGYSFLPIEQEKEIYPHFWVKAKGENNEMFIIDTFLTQVLGADYSKITSEIDRIVVGTWDPSQQHNNALGLLDKKALQNISFEKVKGASVEEEFKDKEITLDLESPERAYSGFYFDTILKIKNDTDEVLKITSFKIDGYEYKQSDISKENINFAILPKTTSTVPLKELRESNFFRYGEKEVNIDITLQGKEINENLKQSFKINLQLHDGAWVVVIVIFNIAVVFSMYGLWRFYLRKRVHFHTA